MRHSSTLAHRSAQVIGVVAAAALALTGCSVTGVTSTQGEAGSGTGTINALFMKQAAYSDTDIATMIADFEKANPKITVKPTFVSYEALHDKIVTAAPSGTYDVVLMDVIWPAEFATKGIVADITDRIPASWKTDMLGGALGTAVYNDKYFGAPWFPSTKLFFYNTELLQKVGATPADVETWDGVLAVAKKLKAAGVQYPISWSWSQSEALICDYTQLLGAFGGQYTDADGQLTINKGPGVEALQWMVDSIKDGLSNPASTTFLEDDVLKSLAQGQSAFGLNWESTFRDLNDPSISSVVDKVAVTQTPAGASGDRPGVNGSMALGIGANSKHQDAAWKFIEYLTNQQTQDKYVKSSLPVWKASYENQSIVATNPDVFAAAGPSYDSMILRPPVPNYNAVSQIIQVELQNALLNKKSPQQALDDAVAAGNKVLKG
jgi:multiple sugar transport system substrate-binding protein